MFKRLSPEEILQQNPQINKQEFEELRQIIRGMRADRLLGTRQAGHKFPSPYARPGVRKDIKKPPSPRMVQLIRRS